MCSAVEESGGEEEEGEGVREVEGEGGRDRDEAIMLLIFPIMLFHNALEYVLLCQ